MLIRGRDILILETVLLVKNWWEYDNDVWFLHSGCDSLYRQFVAWNIFLIYNKTSCVACEKNMVLHKCNIIQNI